MNGIRGWSTGIGGSAFVLVAAIGVASATLITSACACLSTNDIVAEELFAIDNFVQHYAREHGGTPPSFRDVESMYRQKQGSRNFLPSGRIRNDIDPTTRNPKFAPVDGDQATFLYALSADGRSYVLAGIGLREIRRAVFGVPLWRVRNEFPILIPGGLLPAETAQK